MDISASEMSRKALIVFHSYYAEESSQFLIFVVDLKLGENFDGDEITVHMKPNLRFDCNSFYDAAFCMLGSELYVFPGHNHHYNPDGGNLMFIYQLSDEISNLKVEKDMMLQGPSMNGIKVNPIATVTPNGMILVFSSEINVRLPDECCCDFELYDPKEQTWHKLPNLCPCSLSPISRKGTCFRIISFTFMNADLLLLVTREENITRNFTLDIKRKIWNVADSVYGNIPPYRGVVMIGKEIYMGPLYAYDIVEKVMFTFPQLSSPLYVHRAVSIILLDNIRQVKTSMSFNVCFVHSGINEETQDNEFVLQVYRGNSKECIERISELRRKTLEEREAAEGSVLPGITKVRSLKVVVKDKSSFSGFNLYSFAYIPVEFARRKSPRNICL